MSAARGVGLEPEGAALQTSWGLDPFSGPWSSELREGFEQEPDLTPGGLWVSGRQARKQTNGGDGHPDGRTNRTGWDWRWG